MNEPMIHVGNVGEPEVTAVHWRSDGGPIVHGGYVFVAGACIAVERAADLWQLAKAISDAAIELERQHADGDVSHAGCRHRTVRQIGRPCSKCWCADADAVLNQGEK